MATTALCDICGQLAGDDRVIISCPTWTELIDVCQDCFASRFEKEVEKGLKRTVKKYKIPPRNTEQAVPIPEGPAPGPIVPQPEA